MNAKLLKGLLPYISIVVIALGFIKHVIFYNYFNVPIKDFIGFGEILLLFSDDLILLSAFLLPSLILNFFLSDTYGVWNYNKLKTNSAKPFKKRFLSFDYIFGTFILLLTIFELIFSKSYYYRLYWLASAILYCGWVLITEIKIKYDKLNPTPLSIPVFNLLLTTLIVVSLVIVVALGDATKVDYGKYKGTKIVTADTTYISDSTSFYIGKINDFAFYHHKKSRTTTVIPMSEIKSLTIKLK